MFEELLKLIGDNSEAKTIVEKIKSSQEELATNYNSMEVKFNEAVETRDKAKAKLQLVRSKFGLEELTEETLAKVLKGKGDEQSKAEIDNLKQTLKEEVNKRNEIESSYKSKLQTIALDNAFANSGLVDLASNKDTLSILKGLAKEGASFDDDNNIIFKNEDGSTKMVDGKAMGLEDKIKQIASNESYAGLFKPGVNGGSQTPPKNTDGNQSPQVGSMSATEMMKQGRK